MPNNNQFLRTCVIYVTAVGLILGLRILVGCGVFSQMPIELAEILVNGIVPQIIVMLLIPGLMLVLGQKINHEPISFPNFTQAVGWRKLSAKQIGLVVILGFALYLFNIFVASVFANLLQIFGYQYPDVDNVFHGYGGLVIALLLSAVLPGLCEEFLHRGILLNGCIKQFGVVRALIISSLLFGFMHMNAGQFFYTTILGWMMGITVLATGSLWAGMIVHFINNAIATYLSYAQEIYLPGADLLDYLFANPVSLIITLLVVLVTIKTVLHNLARDKFNQNLDAYTVRYLSAEDKFSVNDFDQIKAALPKVINAFSTWRATFAYIETFDVPKPLKPLERALFTALMVLGCAVTMLTLVWGTW